MDARRHPRRRALAIGGFALFLRTSFLIDGTRHKLAHGADGVPRTGSDVMRVTLETPATGVGYFPGLAKPVVIEADQLAEPDARELGELVAGARFFDQPARVGAPPARAAADARQFTITVEQGARRHTVHLSEPIDDPGLSRLVRFLETKAQAVRATARTPKAP